MNKYNAIRLLGLFALLSCALGTQIAYATITNTTTLSADPPAQPNVNSIVATWTDASTDDVPTDGVLDNVFVEIWDSGFTTVIESVAVAPGTQTYQFDNLQPNTAYGVQVIAHFSLGGNQTAVQDTGSTNPDINAPLVTGSVTNIVDGGLTELTATDQYVESCTATDNDVFFVDNCSVDSGSIDTSVLGLQSVLYHATDAATNEGTDTVSTTIQDTTAPVISDPVASQSGVKGILFTDNEVGVSATDLTAVVISAELFAPNATSMQALPNISTGTISFTPDVTGSWSIIYTATDTSSNTDTVTKTVTISLGDAPVILLTGANPQVINLHDPYVELGATASDTEDGNLTGDIVIDASAVDVDTLGSYIVTYDVMDSSGNTAHEERTVNVVTGNIPVITIVGDNPVNLDWGATYTDGGATASDVEDGDLTASIVTSGLPIDTFIIGGYQQVLSYSVTYSVTDSNGNTVQATRIVNVGYKPAEGDSCGGDCYHPHFGVDQNGVTFYEDGLRVNNVIYKIDNVLHNHPDKIIELPVGVPVHFALKASDNYASQIRHMELALGIPKGHFDKQQASVIIDLDIDFQGNYVISYEGDATLVRDVSSKVSILDKTVLWDVTFTPTQHLQHDMFAISAVDEYQYVGTYYINEGITFRGISQNGVPEFTYMDSRGHPHILTIADTTLEDLSVAVDEQGNKWTLDDTTQFWMKEYIRPDMTGSLSKFTGYDRNDYNEFKVYKQGQALIAAQKFDSSKIQGELEATKTYDYPSYERGHNPVPNMIKAYIDYAKSRAGHS